MQLCKMWNEGWNWIIEVFRYACIMTVNWIFVSVSLLVTERNRNRIIWILMYFCYISTSCWLGESVFLLALTQTLAIMPHCCRLLAQLYNNEFTIVLLSGKKYSFGPVSFYILRYLLLFVKNYWIVLQHTRLNFAIKILHFLYYSI